jgi:hypothetical protein
LHDPIDATPWASHHQTLVREGREVLDLLSANQAIHCPPLAPSDGSRAPPIGKSGKKGPGVGKPELLVGRVQGSTLLRFGDSS